jgi:emp24/gp25L/p24 family/GOLD
MSAAVLALTAVVLLQAPPAAALNFKIAPKEELCFHEITHKGNKVLAFFDVLSWGYGAYVYLTVVSPSGKEIQKFEAESEGRVEFDALEDGEYSFCFKNAYSETEVSFWVNTESDGALADVAKEGKDLLRQNGSNPAGVSLQRLGSLSTRPELLCG